MDSNSVKDGDLIIDLERGNTATSHEEECNNDSSSTCQVKRLPSAEKSNEVGGSMNKIACLIDRSPESWKCLLDERDDVEESAGLLDKKVGIDKSTEKPRRKLLKPPRPPKAPLLDSADERLVRELSELAMLKQARVERMKALKKWRNRKAKSSGSNLCALVITILFCAIIIWQGVFPKKTNGKHHGSPESSLESFVPLQRNLSSGPFLQRTHTGAGSQK